MVIQLIMFVENITYLESLCGDGIKSMMAHLNL